MCKMTTRISDNIYMDIFILVLKNIDVMHFWLYNIPQLTICVFLQQLTLICYVTIRRTDWVTDLTLAHKPYIVYA